MEVVVAVLVTLVLAAAVVPQVIARVDRARVEGAQEAIENIIDATTDFNADVRASSALKPFPGKLSHLTTAIVGASASYKDICAQNYTAANATQWKGPYINRVIPPTGLPLAIGTARDSLVRVTSGGGDHLAVELTGVKIEDAVLLNDQVDGDETTTPESLGGVRWTPTSGDSEGRVTLQYLRPVPTC